MPDYHAFLSKLNASSSSASVSSRISHVSQVSQVSPENTLNFETSPELFKHQKAIRVWLDKSIDAILKGFPPDSECSPRSSDKTTKDCSLYVGSGGNAYLHWKLAKYFKAEGDEEKATLHQKHAVSAIKVALSLSPTEIINGREISFYIGNAGKAEWVFRWLLLMGKWW